MRKMIKLNSQDRQALEEARLLIEQCSGEMPSLKQLSRKCGLNEDKFKKGFKLLFGVPPYFYHCRLKMEQAKKMLMETEQSVYEIAWALGYNHSSNFCIAFQRQVGCRPAEFRRLTSVQYKKATFNI